MSAVVLRHRLRDRPLEQGRTAPGVAEVVLRAGAEGRGEFLAVDEELLVALAPPAARGFDVQHDAAEAASPLGPQHHPIRPAVLREREAVAMPLGVEIAQLVHRLGKRRVAIAISTARGDLSSLTSSTTRSCRRACTSWRNSRPRSCPSSASCKGSRRRGAEEIA